MLSPVVAILGPPLAGKSTLVTRLLTEYPSGRAFSVRSHFEPRRLLGLALPPVGTMLPDDVVMAAARPTLAAGDPALLDGLPTTVSQVDMLVDELDSASSLTVLWLAVDRRAAAERARHRRVCFACDGGVNHAGSAHCASCGGPVGRRPDDTEEGFARRWDAWLSRERAVRDRLATFGISIVDSHTTIAARA